VEYDNWAWFKLKNIFETLARPIRFAATPCRPANLIGLSGETELNLLNKNHLPTGCGIEAEMSEAFSETNCSEKPEQKLMYEQLLTAPNSIQKILKDY
jgi:hypothetical protein